MSGGFKNRMQWYLNSLPVLEQKVSDKMTTERSLHIERWVPRGRCCLVVRMQILAFDFYHE
jgi:hypothetical protein